MKIEIDYDGSTAKCLVNNTPIHMLDSATITRVFNAFRIIEKHYNRELQYTETEAPRETYKITIKLNNNG